MCGDIENNQCWSARSDIKAIPTVSVCEHGHIVEKLQMRLVELLVEIDNPLIERWISTRYFSKQLIGFRSFQSYRQELVRLYEII